MRDEKKREGKRERERERERRRERVREKEEREMGEREERESQPPHSNSSHMNSVGTAKPFSQSHAQPSVPQHDRPNPINMRTSSIRLDFPLHLFSPTSPSGQHPKQMTSPHHSPLLSSSCSPSQKRLVPWLDGGTLSNVPTNQHSGEKRKETDRRKEKERRGGGREKGRKRTGTRGGAENRRNRDRSPRLMQPPPARAMPL